MQHKPNELTKTHQSKKMWRQKHDDWSQQRPPFLPDNCFACLRPLSNLVHISNSAFSSWIILLFGIQIFKVQVCAKNRKTFVPWQPPKLEGFSFQKIFKQFFLIMNHHGLHFQSQEVFTDQTKIAQRLQTPCWWVWNHFFLFLGGCESWVHCKKLRQHRVWKHTSSKSHSMTTCHPFATFALIWWRRWFKMKSHPC